MGGIIEVGIVGTGVMGSEIAFVAAASGHRVAVHDVTEDAVVRAGA
jgi:3-hydroxyacyl-CoA dehydrogenase